MGDRCVFHPKTFTHPAIEGELRGATVTVQEITNNGMWPIRLTFDNEAVGELWAGESELVPVDPLEELAEVVLDP